MQKDLKIGLGVGLGLVSVAALWLATRPSLTPQARIRHLRNAEPRLEAGVQPDSRYSMLDTQSSGAGRPLRQVRDEPGPSPEVPRENPPSRVENPASTPEVRRENPESSIEGEPIETEKFYVVRKGDTLSSISHKYYGAASKWPRIFDANRKTIPDANKLPVGIKIIIPN